MLVLKYLNEISKLQSFFQTSMVELEVEVKISKRDMKKNQR